MSTHSFLQQRGTDLESCVCVFVCVRVRRVWVLWNTWHVPIRSVGVVVINVLLPELAWVEPLFPATRSLMFPQWEMGLISFEITAQKSGGEREKMLKEGKKRKIIKGSFLISMSEKCLRPPPGAQGPMGKGRMGQHQQRRKKTQALSKT